MNVKNKKILVTGGSGFIGSNLIKRLVGLQANVDNFDLSVGLNILDSKQLTSYIKKKYDVVFHLAGFSGSVKSNKDQVNSFRINTLATINLCELICKFSKGTKLVISSSRLEYGKPQYLPVNENHPTVPSSAYGLSKLVATQMAQNYHKRNNLDVTIFRTSNVYGPHPSKKFASYNIINHFIDLAKIGGTSTIFGDGNQERDYLYVDDLIEAFLLAIDKKAAGQIYNLGFGKGIKFKEMVELIIKLVGSGTVKYVTWPKAYQQVETGSYVTDISKIKKELGFVPKVSFEEGIAKTIGGR